MIKLMLGVAAFAVIIILAWFLWFNCKTKKLLKKHQAEWGRIKVETPIHGRFDAYCDYCDKLMVERDRTVGACFPKY